MGNISIRGFTPSSKECFTGGTKNLWKIYPAEKSSEKKKASIFLFEKRKYTSTGLSKSEKDANYTILRKEPSNLTKFIHQHCLKILEPFQEDKNIIVKKILK